MVEGANNIVHAETVVEGDVFGKVDIEYPEKGAAGPLPHQHHASTAPAPAAVVDGRWSLQSMTLGGKHPPRNSIGWPFSDSRRVW